MMIYQIFVDVSMVLCTFGIMIGTFSLATNARKIHNDLTIAELQFYKIISRTEDLLLKKPSGNYNPDGLPTIEQEAQMLNLFIDQMKVFFISVSDEHMHLRMKLSFINFLTRNQVTFNLERNITNYPVGLVNSKLNDFLILIDVR